MEPENDPQLSSLLKEWQAPALPSSLERSVLGKGRPSWWRFLLLGTVRVPVPVICVVVLFLAAIAWRWYRPSAAPVVEHALTFHELRPVSALHPKLLRNPNAQN